MTHSQNGMLSSIQKETRSSLCVDMKQSPRYVFWVKQDRVASSTKHSSLKEAQYTYVSHRISLETYTETFNISYVQISDRGRKEDFSSNIFLYHLIYVHKRKM